MQRRKICFVSTEPEEAAFFAERFDRHSPAFCPAIADVPQDAEILSIFINDRIDARFLDGHPRLKLITTRSTGTDHVDAAACEARKIRVANVSGYGENTVAEHTFALMLGISRRLRESTEASVSGRVSHEKLRGIDLRGRTLGVVGAGRVGLHVIRMSAAFGLNVLAYDANPNPLYTELLDFRYTSFEDLLRKSDIITLHVPLNEETYHMINHETLAKCRQGVLIVNTARGRLIESEALLEAINSGQVAGAGLDVLEEEKVFRGGATSHLGAQIADRVRESGGERIALPAARMKEISRFLASNALLRKPQVVFTPHNAYNSEESREYISRTTAENIEKFLARTRSAKPKK